MRSKVIKWLEHHLDFDSGSSRCDECPYKDEKDPTMCIYRLSVDALKVLKNSVSQEVVSQIRWERDNALSQLNEIGKGLGSKMDDVVEAIEEKKARLMTLEEIHAMKPGESCYCEWISVRNDGTVGNGLEFEVVTPQYDLVDSGGSCYVEHVTCAWDDDFKERRWTSKPTKEQMKTTPWEKVGDCE